MTRSQALADKGLVMETAVLQPAPAASATAHEQTEPAQVRPPSRSRALDGLRFYLFFPVFLSHGGVPIEWSASLGVETMFIMSGFLIARILVTKQTGNFKVDLSNFYANRILRLLPVFDICLLYLLVQNKLQFPTWQFTGFIHHKMFLQTIIPTDGAAHFWSLCVEDQFNLFAPFAFILCPAKHRLRVLIALLTITLVTSFSVFCLYPKPFLPVLMPFWAPFFLSGAIFAQLDMTMRRSRIDSFIALAGALGLASWFVYNQSHPQLMEAAWQVAVPADAAGFCGFILSSLSIKLLKLLSIGMIVLGVWRLSNPLTKTLLSNPITSHLGKISYGLYAYHVLVFNGIQHPQLLVRLPLAFLTTVLIASASWYLIEEPLSKLRRRLFLPPSEAAKKFGGRILPFLVALAFVALNVVLAIYCFTRFPN